MGSESESSNIQIVKSILEGLALTRKTENAWTDGEVENPELETLVFKIGESLQPFLIAREFFPKIFSSFPLDNRILNEDLDFFFNTVREKGFYPSPYSPIPAVGDQYTDFAAFCLEFADLSFNYARSTNSSNFQKLSIALANKALNFLTSSDKYIFDENGCRWAGTDMLSRERKGKEEYYTDVYFTSKVIIALRRILEGRVLRLTKDKKNKIRELIRNGGRWILKCTESGLLTGNEENTSTPLIYTTWGLRAIVETYDVQEEDTKKQIPPLVTTYVKAIDEKRQAVGIALGNEYLTVLSPTVETPLYYEDRSDWGGILLTLISLKKLPELDSLIEETNYRQVLEAVYNGLLGLRNNASKLWYKDILILSIHYYLTEGFLAHEKYIKDATVTLNVTSGMVRRAIKEALTDESLISTLQQDIYQKLQVIERSVQDQKKFDIALKKVRKN